MSRGHRFFHRRAAQGNTRVVTVAVEVVATVDGNGSLLAQETLAPVTPQPSNHAALPSNKSVAPPAQQPLPSAAELPLVPSVPSVPTVALPAVPSVPAVPPFPSYLNVPTVPAYPFSTGNPVVQVAATSGPVSASPSPTPVPDTAVAPSTLLDSPILSASTFSANTTSSSTASVLPSSSFASLDTISASTSSQLFASIAAVPSRSTSSSHSLPSSSSTSSAEASLTSQSADGSVVTTSDNPTSTAYNGSGGTDAPGTAAVPAATTASISGAEADNSPSPLETPKVVGSIVGSLAGAALVLAIILLLLRRHKRKRGGALQLTGDDRTDNNQSVRQAPPTANSLVPIAFLNRFSGLSGKTAETSLSGGERSFQRVSGRKLPSAFSEGMTSDQFSRGGTLSGSSFYQDDHGVYGGAAVSKEFGKEIGDTSTTRESGHMNIRPSPARTPVIRHPDDGNPFATDGNYLSPPQSPNSDRPPRGTLGRSLPSADGSRSSRFTENV